MKGPNYFEHPIFLLYWIALKKKVSLKEWKEMMDDDINNAKKHGNAIPDPNNPITFAIEFIDKYGK